MTIAGNTQMMYWNQRRSRLPDGYREVDYLESTGAQWIDTGVIPSYAIGDDVYSQIEFQCLDLSKQQRISGVLSANNYTQFFLNLNPSAILGVQVNSHEWCIYGEADTDWHTAGYDVRTKTANFDGTEYRYPSIADSYEHSLPLYLFARNNNRVTDSFFRGRIRSFTYTDIRSYIPCVRTSDSKPGMYDLCGSICPLTGTPFYINAGAGADFLWGEL